MKFIVKINMAIILLVIVTLALVRHSTHEWSGVDEKVIEHYAEVAGRPARDPYINTDQGDILLFLFLSAGIAGGFISGYCFRVVFPPATKDRP